MSVPVDYPAAGVVGVPIAYPRAWIHPVALTWKWAQTLGFRATTDAHTWSSP